MGVHLKTIGKPDLKAQLLAKLIHVVWILAEQDKMHAYQNEILADQDEILACQDEIIAEQDEIIAELKSGIKTEAWMELKELVLECKKSKLRVLLAKYCLKKKIYDKKMDEFIVVREASKNAGVGLPRAG